MAPRSARPRSTPRSGRTGSGTGRAAPGGHRGRRTRPRTSSVGAPSVRPSSRASRGPAPTARTRRINDVGWTSPARSRSWMDCSRSPSSSSGWKRTGSWVTSRHIGSPSASRSRSIHSTSESGGSASAAATSSLALVRVKPSSRADGRSPRDRMSSVNEVSRGPIATVGRRVNVPRPRTRSSLPSRSSSSSACRSVIRLTPNRSASSRSDGIRSPPGVRRSSSRSASWISTYFGSVLASAPAGWACGWGGWGRRHAESSALAGLALVAICPVCVF